MKKLVLTCAAATVLMACDGDMIKSAARVVLADEIQQMQQNQQQAQPVQQGQLQPVQPTQNMDTPVGQMVQGASQQPQVQQPAQVQQPIQQPVYIDDGAMQQPVQEPVVTRQNVQPKPASAPRRATGGEQIVRKRAYVLTQYGDNVRVRSAPSRNGRYVGYLYDGEEIWIVGETKKCQSIDGIYGCWVKVLDSNGLTGYSFGGYLQY